jgi:hypothetical protein
VNLPKVKKTSEFAGLLDRDGCRISRRETTGV